MLTNPSTLGLFDENIEEIAEIFHGAGRAHVLRRREPERRLRHLAARRHGLRHRPHQPAQDVLAAARRRRAGRRADRGPRQARAVPAGAGGRRATATTLPASTTTGRSRSARCAASRGPFGVFVRSYAYIRAYGPRLREMSEAAVLNANYLLARLKDAYDLPFDRLCMHEFVLVGADAEARARRRRRSTSRSG